MQSQRLARLFMVASLALPLACGKGDPKPSGATSASAPSASVAPPAATTSAPPESAGDGGAPDAGSAQREAPRIKRRTGPAAELFNQARTLKLNDDQKSKLDELDQSLWGDGADDEESKTAMKEFYTALVEGIKAGKIDNAKVDAQYELLDAADKKRSEAEAKALNDLHATLDAAQRKTLVEAIRRRHPDPTAKAKPTPKPAPKPGQKPAKPPIKAAPKPPQKPPAQLAKEQAADRAKRRQQRIALMLGLDEPQKARIVPILARFDTEPFNKAQRELAEKRLRAILTAFEGEDFDAGKLDLGKGPRTRMQNRVAYVIALLAVLKPDQREKLARTIERPVGRRWGGAVVGDAGPVDDD